MNESVRAHRALECLLGVPTVGGNKVDVLRNGEEAHPAMLEAIGAATSTIDIQTYGNWNGVVGHTFARAMADRAGAGVRVRVLLDAFGRANIDKTSVAGMEAAGVEIGRFRPLIKWRATESTHRGHRKILVCDGRVAFTGGWGIGDEWAGDARDRSEWRDTAVRLQGPAVNGLLGAFVNNWAELAHPFYDEDVDPFPLREEAGTSSVQIVRGDAETGWGDIATLSRVLLGFARHRVRISADYLAPDPAALDLLCSVARKGVKVEVLRPGPRARKRLPQIVSRSYYYTLLESGVRIWEYQPTAFETKVITVDGEVANVGPVDFDAGSLTLNDEVTVVVFDPSVVAVLDDQFDADLERAEPVAPEDRTGRDRGQRAMEATTRFIARHL